MFLVPIIIPNSQVYTHFFYSHLINYNWKLDIIYAKPFKIILKLSEIMEFNLLLLLKNSFYSVIYLLHWVYSCLKRFSEVNSERKTK